MVCKMTHRCVGHRPLNIEVTYTYSETETYPAWFAWSHPNAGIVKEVGERAHIIIDVLALYKQFLYGSKLLSSQVSFIPVIL